MDCPECGAAEGACETRYHECLVKEFEDPQYGAVHHLTVAAYMLQHSSKLTKEGWLYERELLREFLVENKPPARIRKQDRDLVDSDRRKFKIASKDGRPKIARRTWTKTVLDVRLDDGVVYCQDIKDWARASLREAESASPEEARDNER